MNGGLLFVALSLGVFRAWRLIGRDDITAWLRSRLIVHGKGRLNDWLLKLVSCPWCLGSWLSFAAVYGVDRWFRPLALPVVWAAAVAALVGLVGEADRRLMDD